MAGRVLVVDDDEPTRELLATILRSAGFETAVAASGGIALALALKSRPSLVLLDVSMPGLSGYEVCHELRERFGQTLPILFLSGERTESFDRVAGFLIGADDYLVKPVSPDELVARVRRRLAVANEDRVQLTEREREVLTLLAEGLTGAEIARHLTISPSTASKHIEHVVSKLGVHSRTQALALAFKLGLI